jgi:uncharacterized membrane protein YagU involved in acid resistance
MSYVGRTQFEIFQRSQQPQESSRRQPFRATPQPEQTGGRRLWKGLLSGLVAGGAATCAMTIYQVKSQEWIKRRPSASGPRQLPSVQPHSQENPTIAMADRISRAVRGRDVHAGHRQLAGNIVHYAFGILQGGIFGLISESVPLSPPLRGLAYGTLLWGAVDETALPALGLARWWPDYPAAVHANALGAHLVYGASLDLVQGGLRELMDMSTRDQAEEKQLAGAERKSFGWLELIRPRPAARRSPATRRQGRFHLEDYAAEEAYEREQPTGYRRAA